MPIHNLEQVEDFFKAAKNGDFTIVNRYLQDNPDLISGFDRFGGSVLNEVASVGNIDMAQFLFERIMLQEENLRVKIINAQSFKGNTPLHRAIISGHADMARLLIKNGANVHLKNGKGQKPLQKDIFYVAIKPRTKACYFEEIIMLYQQINLDEIIDKNKNEHTHENIDKSIVKIRRFCDNTRMLLIDNFERPKLEIAMANGTKKIYPISETENEVLEIDIKDMLQLMRECEEEGGVKPKDKHTWYVTIDGMGSEGEWRTEEIGLAKKISRNKNDGTIDDVIRFCNNADITSVSYGFGYFDLKIALKDGTEKIYDVGPGGLDIKKFIELKNKCDKKGGIQEKDRDATAENARKYGIANRSRNKKEELDYYGREAAKDRGMKIFVFASVMAVGVVIFVLFKSFQNISSNPSNNSYFELNPNFILSALIIYGAFELLYRYADRVTFFNRVQRVEETSQEASNERGLPPPRRTKE